MILREAPMAIETEGLICVDTAARGSRQAYSAWTKIMADRHHLLRCGDTSRCGITGLRATLAFRPIGSAPPDGQVTWVIERPRKYTEHGAAHGDLDRMLARIDEIKALASAYNDLIYEVYPSTWKGNVPKKIVHKRASRSLGANDIGADDLVVPGLSGYDHNVWDAVSIGAWVLRRTGRGGSRR